MKSIAKKILASVLVLSLLAGFSASAVSFATEDDWLTQEGSDFPDLLTPIGSDEEGSDEEESDEEDYPHGGIDSYGEAYTLYSEESKNPELSEDKNIPVPSSDSSDSLDSTVESSTSGNSTSSFVSSGKVYSSSRFYARCDTSYDSYRDHSFDFQREETNPPPCPMNQNRLPWDMLYYKMYAWVYSYKEVELNGKTVKVPAVNEKYFKSPGVVAKRTEDIYGKIGYYETEESLNPGCHWVDIGDGLFTISQYYYFIDDHGGFYCRTEGNVLYIGFAHREVLFFNSVRDKTPRFIWSPINNGYVILTYNNHNHYWWNEEAGRYDTGHRFSGYRFSGGSKYCGKYGEKYWDLLDVYGNKSKLKSLGYNVHV